MSRDSREWDKVTGAWNCYLGGGSSASLLDKDTGEFLNPVRHVKKT